MNLYPPMFFPPIILTTINILRGMFLNSVKLPSIILIATSRSLAWPDPTVFFFCAGEELPRFHTKTVLPRETTQCECREDFLLHGCLINLLQQVDYIRQLCIRVSHNHRFNRKSLNRHHRY